VSSWSKATSVTETLAALKRLAETLPESTCRYVAPEDVESTVELIMRRAKETGTDPLAVARVYMRKPVVSTFYAPPIDWSKDGGAPSCEPVIMVDAQEESPTIASPTEETET
jgi:hypothetical protein